jgi:hypothetical protein
VPIDGVPLQRIADHRLVKLPVLDLRATPETDRQSEAQRIITDTIRRPFDLSRDLMVRFLLLRLSEEEYIFIRATHHIASDGWSSGIFWRELTTLYHAFSSKEPCALPELPIQYADYAEW